MLKRRFFIEAAVIVLAAILCAAVSNALADRNRKLAWKADYPNAMTVTRRAPVAPADLEVFPTSTQPAPPATQTSEPAPAPSAQPLAGTPVPPPQTAADAVAATPSPEPTPTPRPPKAFPPNPQVPYVEITPEDVQELYGRKTLFIDARRTDDYERGHIAGARSMPVWEADIDERVKALYEEGRNQQDPLVIYCSGGNCEDSHMLAEKLWGVGFDNVLVYRDGFPDWTKRGGAISKGATP